MLLFQHSGSLSQFLKTFTEVFQWGSSLKTGIDTTSEFPRLKEEMNFVIQLVPWKYHSLVYCVQHFFVANSAFNIKVKNYFKRSSWRSQTWKCVEVLGVYTKLGGIDLVPGNNSSWDPVSCLYEKEEGKHWQISYQRKNWLNKFWCQGPNQVKRGLRQFSKLYKDRETIRKAKPKFIIKNEANEQRNVDFY